MSFLGQEAELREYQDRFRFVFPILAIAAGLIFFRLAFLQIFNGDRMRQIAEENRIKRVRIPAPRGMIFDRNRTLLIDNRPSFDLEVIPQYLRESGQLKEILERLAKVVNLPVDEIERRYEKSKIQANFLPLKLKTDLTRDEVALVESNRIGMPGVGVEMEIKRTNLFEEVAAHLLGYIGQVDTGELAQISKTGKQYSLGENIGKFGIEKQLEDLLRGKDGHEVIEVDALGRRLMERTPQSLARRTEGQPSAPGRNLVLTIDQDLQLAAIRALGPKVGAVVALDPNSGEVLAMVSKPSFNPTEFSRGVSAAVWQKLLNDENRPLRDKTTQDHYSPGSTFKVVTAIAGLQEGVISPTSTFFCPGNIKVGNRIYHCHKKSGHGDVNVVGALTQSCDVFFYRVSQKLKSVNDIARWATHLGLGTRTGIQLPREVSGLIPTEEWKLEKYGQAWIPGETLHVAIGQGYVLSSVLQLANLYSVLVNGGIVYRPHYLKRVETHDGKIVRDIHPEVMERTGVDEANLKLVREGLRGVINNPHGTAYHQRIPGFEFAGKTGTSQVIRIAADKIYSRCENMRYNQRNHGLFVGYAPADKPQIVVSVLAEHSCHGSTGAAPVAREVILTFMKKYYPDLVKAAGSPNAAAPQAPAGTDE